MTNDIKSILVPHDFSAGSKTALEYGLMMARRFGASIHLVHVCETPMVAVLMLLPAATRADAQTTTDPAAAQITQRGTSSRCRRGRSLDS